MFFRSFSAASALMASTPALAINIVITNDDGFTSNVAALYQHLKENGHDVIVSVPCYGQSGMGAALSFLKPLESLPSNCHNDAANAGSEAAGAMKHREFKQDFYYVNGTPVMALLYGLDVQAQQRWGKGPDLILSGPNEGQNLGSMVITSGTVSNAQYGTIRGIPSIALSGGIGTASARLKHPDSAKIARLSGQLVAYLQAKAEGGRLLPKGLALNVNFPDNLSDNIKWKPSRIGNYDAYTIRFTENLQSARQDLVKGLNFPPKPGITVERNPEEPTVLQQDNESVVFRNDISLSVMQVGYDHAQETFQQMSNFLAGLNQSEAIDIE